MEKSVYSLVLMDEVVKAIDQMAHQQNTSRSNLINQILAEEVMLTTPEMRMRDIFERMIEAMEEVASFQVKLQPSDSCISIRSVMEYKYNPTIRYFIELYRNDQTAIGQLKVTSRTKSRELQKYLYDFFSYFSKLEQIYMARYFPNRPTPYFSIEGEGRFIRELILTEGDGVGISNDDMALAMGDYIKMLDQSLAIYLTHLKDLEVGRSKIERNYVEFLNSKPVLL